MSPGELLTAVPEVSVVMSVYNGASALPTTLQSVLDQQGCNFEFIVVNDGSADASGAILDECAAGDARLRVIHQTNTGLTRALIRGCEAAHGEFIARQDCGDISLPGRLAAQVEVLRSQPDVAMVACGTRFVGPAGELLHDVTSKGEALQTGLARLNVRKIKGPPHHGGTMFRRTTYQAVGGYRQPFVVAQDIDLWLRLSEQGKCLGQEQLGYEASVEAGSISGRRRSEQFRLAELAIDCALVRRKGQDEQAVLESFAKAPFAPTKKGPVTSGERARFYYFVGSCLRGSNPPAARHYFRRALGEQPLFLRAWLRSVLG